MYRTKNPQKAFEVRLRLFFENLLWFFVFIGSQTLILKRRRIVHIHRDGYLTIVIPYNLFLFSLFLIRVEHTCSHR